MTKMLEDRAAWEAAYESGWYGHYQAIGEIEWSLYNRPKNDTTPAGSPITLTTSRLMLISTAGGYLPESQRSFEAADDLGDYSIRVMPMDTPPSGIDYAHDHYDQTAVREDSQVLLPLAHLQAMVDEGRLGSLTPSLVSFMGYQPDVGRVLDETFPAIMTVVEQEQPDAILLIPS